MKNGSQIRHRFQSSLTAYYFLWGSKLRKACSHLVNSTEARFSNKLSIFNLAHVAMVGLFVFSQFMVFAKTQTPNNIYIDKGIENFPKVSNSDQSVFQLFSHGRPGELLIDGDWKNAQEIASFVKAKIHNSSMEIQSLNIYGCEFAKGKVGEDAVSYLESTLGLTVAASTNLSGNDGDWILEIGQPRAAIAVSEYKGNLQWTLADICTTCDFDGDGIPNNLDLDNDNDGIKDDIESPSCFYNLDVLMYGDRTSLITVTTPLSLAAGYSITDAVDALPTNGATTDMVKFNSATLTNQEFLRFQFPYAVPLNHISLLWYRGAPAIDFTTGTTYSIQGSNDPSSGWTTITSSATITNNNRTTEMDFTNTTSYLYYRIFVTSGTLNTNELEDIMFGFSEKVMELPIAGCSADLDGDGFPNHMDTDADGDGCPDAKEGL